MKKEQLVAAELKNRNEKRCLDKMKKQQLINHL